MTHTHHIEVELRQFRVTTTITLDQRILDEACATLEQTTSGASKAAAGPWYEGDVGYVVRIAAGLAVAAAVVFVAFVLWSPTGTERPRTVSEPGPNTPGGVGTTARRLAKERSEIETMTATRNIGGLVTMLGTGLPASRRLAAESLGQIGDARALPALSGLAERWRGDPADNPFAQAIEQITDRIQDTEPNVPDANEAPISQVVPQTAPPPVLSGTITDIDSGTPLEGVLVQLHAERLYEAKTNSKGFYGFDAVEKEGSCMIELLAPEHITPADWERDGNFERVQLRRGRPAVKDFALAQGAKILVTIVNEAGQPVRRANVHAAYVKDDVGRGPKRPIWSDANGIASLGGLPPEQYVVALAHADYALAGQTVTLTEPGDIESVIFVLEKGADVVGVATCSDGLPATGWQIIAKPEYWHCAFFWPDENLVAEDGTLLLRHIVPGVHRLEVYIPVEGGSRGIWSTDVNLPPETGLLDLRIPMPSSRNRVSISGTVVFTGGSYDGGGRIDAYSATGGSGSTDLDAGQTEFTLTGLIPGLYDLSVWAGGQRRFANIKAPSEGVVLEMPVGQQGGRGGMGGTGGRAMPVGRPSALVLSGTVVDEAGRPVEGVTVSDRYTRAKTAEAKQAAMTDARGRFTIANVPGGHPEHWFAFRHPDYARAIRCIGMVEQGVSETQIVLRKGRAAEGTVYDQQGQPLPETDVYFMDESDFRYWAQNRGRLGKVTTNASGYYRIEHLPEEVCYAFREDPDNQLGVVLASILPRAGQILRLDMGGPWKTTGRLVRNGEPVAKTKLLVTYRAGYDQGFEAYALSDTLGRFSLYGLPTGRRSLYWAIPGGRGTRQWFELTAVDFERGVDVDLGDLEAVVAEATVELMFADESLPIDRWEVSLNEPRAQGPMGRQVGQLQPRRDDSDPFIFTALSAGHYDVAVSREGYPTIRDRLHIEPGQSHGAVAVTIPAGTARISGEVVPWQEFEPWPLLLQSADGRIEMLVMPDANGAFEIEHLPAGDYHLASLPPSEVLVRVHLAAGGHEAVRIEAKPIDEHGYLRVLIVTDEGLPLATPDVWLERDGHVVESVFNNDDATSFAAAPGTYTLCVHYPGFRSVHRSVELKTREGRTTQEVLEPLIITMSRE